MRPRLRSYGDTSTRTLSPGFTRMRNRRILPARCASSSWSFSSLTRNIRFGRASVTSPSISSFCSTAMGITPQTRKKAAGGRRRLGPFILEASGGAAPGGELAVAGELLQRRRLQLAHPLRGETDHLADGAQRALAAPVEPEAQPHDLAVAALEALDRAPDRAAPG